MKINKLLLILFLIFLISGCGKKQEKVVNIGVIMPLSGAGAELANQHLKGIEFAVDELNSRQNSIKYKLTIEDDQNIPQYAVNALQKLEENENIDLVITVISNSSLAIAPIINNNSKSILFANCGHPTITTMYKRTFRNFPSTKLEVNSISKFAKDYLQLNSISMLYIDDAYGIGALDMVKIEFPKYNINLITAESYGKLATDSRASIIKVLSKKPEAIYVYGYGLSTATVLNQLHELGYKGKLLGTYNFSQPPISTISKNSIDGAYFTVPFFDKTGKDSSKLFWEMYSNKYHEPPLWNTVVEYDAIMIFDKAIIHSSKDSKDIITSLVDIGDYKGIGGLYKYDRVNNEWLLPMDVAKYEKGNIKYMDGN
jgi:branched-chain amino acid transport system substrate-binding protein